MATRKAQNDEKTVARTRKTQGGRKVAHADAKGKAVVQTRTQRVRRPRTSQPVSSANDTGNAKRGPGRPRKVAPSQSLEATPKRRKITVIDRSEAATHPMIGGAMDVDLRRAVAPWERSELTRLSGAEWFKLLGLPLFLAVCLFLAVRAIF